MNFWIGLLVVERVLCTEMLHAFRFSYIFDVHYVSLSERSGLDRRGPPLILTGDLRLRPSYYAPGLMSVTSLAPKSF